LITAYRDTEVPMFKTFGEIEKLYDRYSTVLNLRGTVVHKPEDKASGTPGAVIAFFQAQERGGEFLSYRVQIPYQYKRGSGGKNAGTTKDQVARLLYYHLKTKFELIASGATTLSREFMASMLVSPDTDLHQALAPKLATLTAADVPRVFHLALEDHRS
jgi:hypothetical protein